MTKIHESKIRITGDTKRGVTAVSRVTGSLKKMAPSMQQVKIGAALMAAAVAGTTAAIVKMTMATAKEYDELKKLSDQLGVSTEFLSKMRVAAEFSGIQSTALDKAIQKMTVSIAEANRGLATYKDAFDDLGISLTQNDGRLKTSETIMMEIADRFNDIEDATLKADIAYRIFGARGMSMVQIMKDGSAGIKDMWHEAEKMGLVVSSVAAQNAAEFNDAMFRVKGTIKGLRNTMAEESMPVFTEFFNKLAVYIQNNRKEIVAFGKDFIISVASMAESLAIGGANILDYFAKLGAGVREIRMGLIQREMNQLIGMQQERAKEFGLEDEVLKGLNVQYQELHQQMAGMMDDQIKWANQPELADRIRALIKDLKNVNIEDLLPVLDKVLGLSPGQVEQTMIKAQEALQMTMEQLQAQHDQIFLDEGERLDLWYSEMYAKVGEHEEGKFLLYQIYMEKKRLLGEQQAQQEVDIARRAAQQEMSIQRHKLNMTTNMLNTTQNVLGAFASFSDKNNKAMFIMQKAVAIAMIWVQTQIAAMSAAAAVAGIPIVGPALAAAAYSKMQILGYISMAAAAATAIGQMSAGGGSSAPAISGGGGYSGGGGSGGGYTPTYTPDEVVADEETAPASKVINVHIYGNVVDQDRYARDLVEATRKALEDGA